MLAVSEPMPDKYFLELAEKWSKQTITEGELKELEQWYQQNQDQPIEVPQTFAASEQELGDRILNAIRQKAGIQTRTDLLADKATSTRIARIRFLKYAAAVLIFASSIIYVLNSKKPKSEVKGSPVARAAEEIVPPSQGAILTLSSGKQIILDDRRGTVANEGGVSVISKNGGVVYDQKNTIGPKSEILYNTVSTPRGRQYQLTLEDGTKIWLNAASSVRFPAVFSNKDRRVEVTGEAYLEVVHNDAKPFIVTVNNMQVEVLGTRFNVNSYNDDGFTKTTLLQGKVKASNNAAIAILKPGQQAMAGQYSDGTIKVVDDIDLEEVMAWKNGIFRFNNSNIRSIMKQVERWYDVDVIYQVSTEDLDFSGYVGKKEDVSQILKIMELTGLVHFKIQGRTIVVTK
jgi:transmembrane sensor